MFGFMEAENMSQVLGSWIRGEWKSVPCNGTFCLEFIRRGIKCVISGGLDFLAMRELVSRTPVLHDKK